MLYSFGKTLLGHLCFKYLKMIISTNYALKLVFPKALFLKIYRIIVVEKNARIFKIQIAWLVLIVEKCYAYH